MRRFQPFARRRWRRGGVRRARAVARIEGDPDLRFPEIRVGNNGEKLTGLRVLTKPYRREELARIIRETLDR